MFEHGQCRDGVTKMVRPKDSKYDAFAKHRILTSLYMRCRDLGGWSQMATAITLDRGIEFQRTNFNRIRNGDAGDGLLDIVVDWLTMKDANFPKSLRAETIFSDVGISARDYYFHLFAAENLTDWDEQLLTEFEGVYLCAPEDDTNSYMPVSRVRDLLINDLGLPQNWRAKRSVDIKQYINQRSFIILRRTNAYYYQAAEIPMGALFPSHFETMDIKSYYEGIAVASSNTIHVFLRECLSRVPKVHSIIIKPKAEYKTFKFRGIDIYANSLISHLDAEFAMMSDNDVMHMKKEMALDLESDVFLRGSAQSNISPVAWTKNRVDMVFGREQIYHRKLANFLDNPAIHFVHPEIDIAPQLTKLLDNPLLISEMLASNQI